MDILIGLAIIAALVVANGLFVAAEFAIVGAPRASVEHQASQGSALAQRVRRVLEDPRRTDRYIATTQIGISVASLGLGMYGEHQLAEWIAHALEPYDDSPWIAAHAMASVIAIGLLTYLHIVLGEMVPKALALQRAERTVLYVTPPILLMQAAVLPLVVALNGIGNGLLKLFGVKRTDEGAERYHTSEELQFIIEESQEGGLLRGESGRILRELFEFGDLSAGEVMVPRVLLVGIPVDTAADELRAIVRAHPHTRYPVYSGDLDNIVGSLHIKDLLGHLVSGRPVSARDARPLPHVPAAALLDEVLAAMRRFRAQMAVVMDEHGGTAGLVTIEDLFEEVVGEIEEGRGRTPIARDAQGRVHVRGTVRLEEAGEALGCTLEHPEVSTVSGLVLTLLGRPAVAGDVVTYNNVRIEVTSVAGRGVQDAMVSIATRSAPARTDRPAPPGEPRA
jgi:CBS domain containing-hemolysin-like protein